MPVKVFVSRVSNICSITFLTNLEDVQDRIRVVEMLDLSCSSSSFLRIKPEEGLSYVTKASVGITNEDRMLFPRDLLKRFDVLLKH